MERAKRVNISCLAELNPRTVGARTCVIIDKCLLINLGGVTQPDRVVGSYPISHWFKSSRRHLTLATQSCVAEPVADTRYFMLVAVLSF